MISETKALSLDLHVKADLSFAGVQDRQRTEMCARSVDTSPITTAIAPEACRAGIHSASNVWVVRNLPRYLRQHDQQLFSLDVARVCVDP